MSSAKLHVFVLSTAEYQNTTLALPGVANSVQKLVAELNKQTTDICWCADKSQQDATQAIVAYIQAKDNDEDFADEDVFLFYFCGHGVLTGRNQEYLYCGTADTWKDNSGMHGGLEWDRVMNEVKLSKIKKYIMILDCCSSAAMMGSPMGDTTDDIAAVIKLSSSSMGGGVYVSSTKSSAESALEIPIDGTKYAAFTYYFAETLREGIQGEESYISIQSLVDETRKRICQYNANQPLRKLPFPLIQTKNNLSAERIFRNPATPEPEPKREPEQLGERVIKVEEREKILPKPSQNSELVFALVGAFGTELDKISELLKDALVDYGYEETTEISISRDILQDSDIQKHFLTQDEFDKYPECRNKGFHYRQARYLMELGTRIRYQMGNNFLSMMAVERIAKARVAVDEEGMFLPVPRPKHSYIIRSLKHPEEVNFLREVYGNGFYLFGIYESRENRRSNNTKFSPDDMEQLMEIDEREKTNDPEKSRCGQQERNAYQMADFFIDYTDKNHAKADIRRMLDLIFGNPFITPTFSEYAMFMAWCASLRSADLSRQIGAVVCKDNEVLASGANDCPAVGGGLYWPQYNPKYNEDGRHEEPYTDVQGGRDYTLGKDTNKDEFVKIAKDLCHRLGIPEDAETFRKIKNSTLGNLTEYGRVVHAEMEAIAACARNHISCKNAELYVTTFPCHNCAKHIIAAGFCRVVYIEAYPKSKTLDFYKVEIATQEEKGKVCFSPFFGVGPRRFIDMFAMSANFLPDKMRKQSGGENSKGFPSNYGIKAQWSRNSKSALRSQMLNKTYIELETDYSNSCGALRDVYGERRHMPWEMDKEQPDASPSPENSATQ